MAVGNPADIPDDTIVHRVGGPTVENLRLSALDLSATPPGLSVLLGGTPEQAAQQMRQAFPRSRKWQTASQTVGSTTAGAIRQADFEIVPDPTSRFPNHALIIHAEGSSGFSDANLSVLSPAFTTTTGC